MLLIRRLMMLALVVGLTQALLPSLAFGQATQTPNATPSGPTGTLAVAPNPGTGIFRLNLVGQALVKVFDPTGNMLKSSVLQSGQSLDITALPPGLYAIVAQEEHRTFTGKIIKQ